MGHILQKLRIGNARNDLKYVYVGTVTQQMYMYRLSLQGHMFTYWMAPSMFLSPSLWEESEHDWNIVDWDFKP